MHQWRFLWFVVANISCFHFSWWGYQNFFTSDKMSTFRNKTALNWSLSNPKIQKTNEHHLVPKGGIFLLGKNGYLDHLRMTKKTPANRWNRRPPLWCRLDLLTCWLIHGICVPHDGMEFGLLFLQQIMFFCGKWAGHLIFWVMVSILFYFHPYLGK